MVSVFFTLRFFCWCPFRWRRSTTMRRTSPRAVYLPRTRFTVGSRLPLIIGDYTTCMVKNGRLQAIFLSFDPEFLDDDIFKTHLDISFKLWWLLHLLMLFNGIVNGGSPSHRFQDWVMVWLGWFGVPSWLRKRSSPHPQSEAHWLMCFQCVFMFFFDIHGIYRITYIIVSNRYFGGNRYITSWYLWDP